MNHLKKSIFYYLKHQDKAMEIAKNGFEYTMKYHRCHNRVEEMIEIAKNVNLNAKR